MSEQRISWLDGWRGAACWLMLVYHLLFDLVMFGWLSYEAIESWPLVLLQKSIATSFILCAGISAELTHSNLRRGIVTLLAGAVVMAVSFAVGAPILFGVLQFLGVCMLLYAAAGRWLRRVPVRLAPVLCLALFVLTQLWTSAVRVEVRWLFWLGFIYEDFVSYDFFPLLPYVFLFLLGAWAGRVLPACGAQLPFMTTRAPAVLTWPGRRTLWIYLLHQPVLFGACLLAYRLL